MVCNICRAAKSQASSVASKTHKVSRHFHENNYVLLLSLSSFVNKTAHFLLFSNTHPGITLWRHQ